LRKFAKFRLTVLAILLLASTVAAEDNTATQQQLNTLNKKIQGLKKSLSSQQTQRSSAAKALQSIEKDIGQLAVNLHQNNNKQAQQQSRLSALERQQQQLYQQQIQQKQLIAEHVRKAYTLGKESQLKMLLNQENPEKLSRTLTYFDYFNRARSEEMRKYRNTLQALDAVKPAITRETEALEITRRELAKQELQLQQQKQQRNKTLASLDSDIKINASSIGKLDNERKSLEEVLQAVEREITNIAMPASYQPFKALRGKMPWPITGKLLNRYGSSRHGSSVTWQGIQIEGNEGDTVKAIHNGRIVFSDWLRGAGLLIIVDHGGDYLSLYAHNQSLLRAEGDWVRSGEGIATVGNSGGQRQAGLYFEIRYKGQPSDPRSWCR
jgi:septal ring factor EnvC (AmiA/AmiB activator)